jgi:hypothetical protein
MIGARIERILSHVSADEKTIAARLTARAPTSRRLRLAKTIRLELLAANTTAFPKGVWLQSNAWRLQNSKRHIDTVDFTQAILAISMRKAFVYFLA